MPVHDWTRVTAGTFHHFHQDWTIELARTLNRGVLQPGYFALAEQVPHAEVETYVSKANQIAIRHPLGAVVAVVEIVSPGNKESRTALKAFVEKAAGFLHRGINLLIIDLFPPGPRDPQGIHKAIWDEVREEPFELPPDKPLTLAGYSAGPVTTAYNEPVAVGDVLPDMPLFLGPEAHVSAPLETTYQTTWSACPGPMRELLEAAAS